MKDASCNWVDWLQVGSVQFVCCEQAFTVVQRARVPAGDSRQCGGVTDERHDFR